MRRRIKKHNSPETGFWRLYHQAIREGDAVTAVTIARQAIAAYPKKRDLKLKGMWLRALARALFTCGEYDAAISAATDACVNQPDQYERALSLITAAANLGFIDKRDELPSLAVAVMCLEETHKSQERLIRSSFGCMGPISYA